MTIVRPALLRLRRFVPAALLVAWCLTPSLGPVRAGEQLMTLGAPDGNRFAITDKVWPALPGEAHVCLWKDDALAAVTITVDDNTRPDHDWWMQTAAAYNVKVTWFVITCLVEANPSYHGTWAGFQTLHNVGHDIQSHTVTHLDFSRGFDPDDGDHGINAEYRDSKAEIETRIGAPCITLAYPGGASTVYNDETVADDYFIAARGTAGVVNPVNAVNYIRTNSIGGLVVSNPSAPWAQLINIFDPAVYRANNYRAWYVTHYHGLNDTLKANIIEAMVFLQQKDAEVGVWIPTFREGALYGQQRDSSTLTVTAVEPDRIAFTLTDRMHDGIFTYPLTVKVRLYDTWTDVAATQNGRPVEAAMIERDGGRFALVQAVPDQGPVELTPAPANSADFDGDGDVDLDDFVILKTNFGTPAGATAAEGDADGDGDVDLDDFVVLKNNFGA
ncbi:MAG: polysaccharide deacetylase family protein [Planctomycetes bacterium]|nr:polysaccharide deacetylase family protein [Planctomycetota bacterium]